MRHDQAPLVAAILALVAMAVFPLADGIAKTLVGSVPGIVIVWMRFFGSALLVTPIYLIFARDARPTKQSVTTEFLRACIIMLAFGSFVTAFRTISFAEAMTYYSFAPIVATALAVVFLKERLSVGRVVALGLGFIGVVIALDPRISPEPGAWFAIATGCLYGTYLMLNRVVAVRWHPVLAMFLQYWIGSACMLPFVWSYLTVDLLAYMPALAGIAAVSLGCNLMLIFAFKLAESSYLAPLMYVEIPSAMFMAVLLFGESVPWNLILGAALIFVAGLVALKRTKQDDPLTRPI